MKKIIRLFTALLILSAAAGLFYIGWIQIKLDENTYAVAFTKSSGYLEKVFKPGEFSWTPYRLIPGNFKLLEFIIQPRIINTETAGILPSGDVYGKFMPGQPDFTYRISFTARYTLKPEALPSLAENDSLTPDNMENFYKAADSRINSIITGIIKDNSSDTKEGPFLRPEKETPFIKAAVEKELPYVTFLGISFSEIHFPDAELYNKARENYFSYTKNRTLIEDRIKQASAEKEVMEASKIELLKRYGEILKEYPELVQVLSANPSIRSAVLPSITLKGADSGE